MGSDRIRPNMVLVTPLSSTATLSEVFQNYDLPSGDVVLIACPSRKQQAGNGHYTIKTKN